MHAVSEKRLLSGWQQLAALFRAKAQLISQLLDNCPIRTSPLEEATRTGIIND